MTGFREQNGGQSSGQRQISDMLGERVRKPRPFGTPGLPHAKRQKTTLSSVSSLAPAHSQVQQNTITEPPVLSLPTPPSTQEKRQLRLTEILKRERQARGERNAGVPAIVYGAPHMDSRRPVAMTAAQQQVFAGASGKNIVENHVSVKPPIGPKKDDMLHKCLPQLKGCAGVKPDTRVVSFSDLTSNRIRAPGSEYIAYDRSMLPSRHKFLLDALSGMEAAVSLIRTRQALPDFGSVRKIVAKSTRRNFLLRHLSQLAHLVPEAVAVLPPLRSTTDKNRSDSFIIRLDDATSLSDIQKRNVVERLKTGESRLGDTATRARRRLLHSRLLAHVREHHEIFLRREGINKYHSNIWHPNFDLHKDVPDLIAPPLYPVQLSVGSKGAPNGDCTDKVPSEAVCANPEESSRRDADIVNDTPAREIDDCEDVEDSNACIPVSLLERVRARAQAKAGREANRDDDDQKNSTLLSKLPTTMDTVRSLLRNERREAMGWAQLALSVSKVHPQRWSQEDVAKQLDAIAHATVGWCRKVALKGRRGGFAFRVVSDSMFNVERAKVSSLKALTM